MRSLRALLVFFLVFFPVQFPADSHAQGLTHSWSRSFGSLADQRGYGIAVDGSNNVIVTGRLEGAVDFGAGPLIGAGESDVLLVKFDANGNLLWSKSFGDASPQNGRDVAVDAAGNIYLTGDFRGSIDFGGGPLSVAAGPRVFVTKLDAAGNHVWSRSFGAVNPVDAQYGLGIAVDGSGNVLVTGDFFGSVNFGGGPLASAGYNDIFVLKLDSAGNHAWSKSFGNVTVDQGTDVAVDAAGGVFVTGYYSDSVNFGGGPLASAGSDDIFLAKFNAAGVHQWSKRFGDAQAQSASSVVVDGGGNVVMAGAFQGTVDFGGGALASAGLDDIFVARFSGAGAHQWSRRYGSADSDPSAEDLAVDGDGNVFVTGELSGSVDFGGGALADAGDGDVFLLKLDGSGSHVWSKRFGDALHQSGHGVAVDGAGSPALTGEFRGTLNFGGAPLIGTGGDGLFVARLSAAGAHSWSLSAGDAVDQTASNVAVDAAGNLIAVGDFRETLDFGDSTIVNHGASSAFIAKFDYAGATLWSRKLGGSGNLNVYDVATDAAGNIVVVGYFEGTVDLGAGPLSSVAGSTDIFLAKYDLNGNYLWSHGFGDEDEQSGIEVVIDGGGNVLVVGYFGGSVNFGGGALTSAGSDDVFVAKFSPSGGYTWGQRFGDSSSQEGYAIAVDGSGNVFITGDFLGSVNFGGGGLVSAGGTDVFVATLDANGVHQWSKRFGDAQNQTGYGIGVDAAGNVYLTGDLRGTANFGGGVLTSAGGTDIFLARLDAAGNHVWSRRFGDASDQLARRIAVDPAGNVFVTGHMKGGADFGGGLLTSAGDDDVFLAKFDAGGAHVWSQRFGDASSQQGWGVAARANVMALVGGFNGMIDLGGGPMRAGGQDVFVSRFVVANAVGVGDTPPRTATSLDQNYPNPFNPSTRIVFRLRETFDVSLDVYDATGRRVRALVKGRMDARVHEVFWDGKDDGGRPAASGVYFYRLTAGQTRLTRKAVLLK